MTLEIGLLVGTILLKTLGGGDVSIENWGDRQGTVLVFLSGRCLTTDEAIQRINDLYEKHRHKEVLFVGVVPNAQETQGEVFNFLQRRGVRFPVYRDPNGELARRFGATITPEAFVIDSSGKLIARGGFQSEESTSQILGYIEEGLLEDEDLAESASPAEGTPINRVGLPREVDDPYGAPYFSSELVFERIPNAPVHHCSTLVETPNGDLLCNWYGGLYESGDDQSLYLSRRRKGERSWSVPEVLIRGEYPTPPGNSVIFRLGEDRLAIVWGRMDSVRPVRRGHWGPCRLMVRYSDDSGMTWTEDRELIEGLNGLPRNLPITLPNGTPLLPLSGRPGFLVTTSDNGGTWERVGEIRGGSQPTLVARADGTLLAYLRSEPTILASESRDGGRTWTEPERTDLQCPGAGIAMTRLANGNLILVHNDSPTERSPLSIRRSTDEGKTWADPLHLESNPGEYSYPCVLQTSDGRIHATYTFRRYSIMHVEMNEDWLIHMDRPN